MIGLIRLVIFGFIAMTIVYVAVSIYSRSLRREKLEDEWAEEHPEDRESEQRDAYIEKGMEEYQNGLRRKLILLVYIVPTILVFGLLIATNLQ
jgi:Ca2+/Na+ antiporter